MTESPFGTGFLLFALMMGAILFSVVYKREAWCRYLCPLGNLGAAYGVASMVYVRANPNVCATQCNTHECFKGSSTFRECPVYHHPLYARDGHFCKLCFSCLRSCPHKSANLYLRAPVQNIWHQGDLSPTLTPLALVVFFLAIVLLAARSTDWIVTPHRFTVAAVLAVVFGIALNTLLSRLLSKRRIADSAIVSRTALALFILGWGPLMAYHLKEVPILNLLQLKISEGSVLAGYLPLTEVHVLLIFQLLAISLAAIFSLVSLRRVCIPSGINEVKLEGWVWSIVVGLFTVYLLISIGLVVI
jgi:hypothetical protein